MRSIHNCRQFYDIEFNWGSFAAQEMVRRFWLGTVGGGYVGHGETYLHPEDILWRSKGEMLHDMSMERLVFLREILEQGPADGLIPSLPHGGS